MRESVTNRNMRNKTLHCLYVYRYLKTKNGKEYAEYARARNQARWEIRKAKREYTKSNLQIYVRVTQRHLIIMSTQS